MRTRGRDDGHRRGWVWGVERGAAEVGVLIRDGCESSRDMEVGWGWCCNVGVRVSSGHGAVYVPRGGCGGG
jgi:hypothetical protein